MTPSSAAASPTPLPARAIDTTAEHPWPVRLLSSKIEEYIARMSPVWVEGQVVQLNRRPGSGMSFLTLRDTDLDASLPVALYAAAFSGGPPIAEGDHVVVHATPTFWRKRGSLQLQADQIRALGVGELLARIEQLKRVLAAEGLFDAERKQPLPFLPTTVGLICGRESKAEHDVVVNARARWPHLRFEIREVAVQGTHAVAQVSAAIAELDALTEVEVIVVARGGGAVEDLLPFSNETLVRAAAACRTPLVSAIGHETDTPLLDLVADFRASTPTDAAKRIVPDMAEESAGLRQTRARLTAGITQRLNREQDRLDAIRSRPVLAAPTTLIDSAEQRISGLLTVLRERLDHSLANRAAQVTTLSGQVTALSPAATLARGYAVVQTSHGHVVRDANQVKPGERLTAKLAKGTIQAEVIAQPADHGITDSHSGG